MQRRDIHQTVTDRIIAQLERGVVPWVSRISRSAFPRSLTTKRPYRGINILLLWEKPYDSRYWVTFKQAQTLGGNIRKGEKGSTVIYWHWRTEEEMAKLALKTPNPAPCYPFMFTVFNLEQCEGLDAPADDTKTFDHSPIEECEQVISSMPNAPKIEITRRDNASYSPLTDTVYIPAAHRFERPADYYSALFHELAHATGHESRLHRCDSSKAPRSDVREYSFEELTAEMAAAFLCARCSIENQAIDESASYINGWLSVFRQDKRILLDAATAAQRAYDYILGLNQVRSGTESESQAAA